MITSVFLGTRKSIAERDNLDAFLKALEGPLAPTNWGERDGVNLPFDAEAVAARLSEHGSCLLLRRKVPRYVAYLQPIGRVRRIMFDVARATPEKHWPAFFETMSKVAAAVEPDFASVQVGPNFVRPPGERDRKVLDLYQGNNVDPAHYTRFGIVGLCMRNIIGPAWIEQFGRETLLSLPIPVRELAWGGLQTDLTEEPWNTSLDVLHEAWSKSMHHLRPTGVLAEWNVREQDHHITFSKGPRSVIPSFDSSA